MMKREVNQMAEHAKFMGEFAAKLAEIDRETYAALDKAIFDTYGVVPDPKSGLGLMRQIFRHLYDRQSQALLERLNDLTTTN